MVELGDMRLIKASVQVCLCVPSITVGEELVWVHYNYRLINIYTNREGLREVLTSVILGESKTNFCDRLYCSIATI